MVCLPVQKIILLLKLVDYLPIQADKQGYNYYLSSPPTDRSYEVPNCTGIQCVSHLVQEPKSVATLENTFALPK